jgi:3-hydroxyacyl-CoA dehydrogenase
MSDLVKFSVLENGVAVITVDNPPVNALSPGVPEGIEIAMRRANSDRSAKAIVLIGAGRTFIAGADINELATAAGPPDLHRLLAEMEDCQKPLVAAMHGTALGGGLEVAMAAHYRVAARQAQVGQPEVNLGLIPGAEGTQRLPRLAGIARAVEMCVTGAPISAAEALQAGIVDQIIEGDLLAGAAAFALEKAAKSARHPKTSERNEKLGADPDNELIYAAGRDQARKIRRNQKAPLKAVEAIRAAATLPFAESCQRERELFSECVKSDQAKAMIHGFLGEREVAKIPGIPKDMPVRSIGSAAIVGAGTMGGGIAMAFANAGIPVRVKDADQAALDRGMSTIRKNYESSVKRGRLAPQQLEDRIALITAQLNYDGFDRADLIVEAAFENMALKKQIFAELGKIAKPGALLASNTSSLDIDEIGATTSRAENVLGLHFFSPANVMRLVEIVRGRATSFEAIASALAIAKKMKKVGVVVGNCHGFVGNRMFLPYMREAQFLVEEGATPQQVDAALYDWGMAMGIFAVDDMAGVDVGWRVRQEWKAYETPGARAPLVLDKLYAMGRYGQKTGAGWYRYGDDRKPIPDPQIDELIEITASNSGIERRTVSDEEIIERCIYIMINEGARILEEGYALRASDIDIVYLTGYGFPAYRGGPMWYADTVGVAKVYQRVCDFHYQHGELWEPAPLLKRLAEENKTFAGLDKERAKALRSA